MDGKTLKADVVVIGGGLSGLSSAYHLTKKDPGLTVLVLEGKERVGGRTFAQKLKSKNGEDTWDLGGQWVGSCQPHIMELVKELDLEVYRQYSTGKKVQILGGDKVATYSGEIPAMSIFALLDIHLFLMRMERWAKTVPISDPGSCPDAEEWDNLTLEQVKNKYLWTKCAKEAIDSAGRCMFGTEASHMSFLYYLSYCNAAGGVEPLISANETSGQQFKIKGGSAQICRILAEKLGPDVVHLEQPVVNIENTEENAIVTTLHGLQITCDKVIIATPPHQTAKINFMPPLPTEKLHVMQRMPVGYLTKIIVTYESAFWREDGYSGEIVCNGGKSTTYGCDSGPLCIGYDATTSDGNPALVMFIGGKQQMDYNLVTPKARKSAVLKSLSQMFGEKAMNCLDYAEKDWSEETYNGGCPVSVGTPGMMTTFAKGLRQPFMRVHFAGTESATVWCGFLNGAVQSGQRAANEVLYNLRPQAITSKDLLGTYYGPSETQLYKPSSWRKTRYAKWTVRIAVICVGAVVVNKIYKSMSK